VRDGLVRCVATFGKASRSLLGMRTAFRGILFSKRSRIWSAFGVVALLIGGCAAVDTLAPRGDTLNRTITDYRNESTLLNILRASYNEPMNFVTMNSATGHGTLGVTAGVATYVLGPGTALAPVAARNYSFGPNSVNASATDDFNIAVLDDPQSYGALMTPLDVTMMGFFLNRNWPMQLLLPIFVQYVRIIPATKTAQRTVYQFNTVDQDRPVVFAFCLKNKPCENFFSLDTPEGQQRAEQCRASPKEFLCLTPIMLLFDYLVQEGLVVQVPVGAIPGTQPPPPARICYDAVYDKIPKFKLDDFLQSGFGISPRQFFSVASDYASMPRSTKQKSSRCDSSEANWTKPADFSQGTKSAQAPGGGTTAPEINTRKQPSKAQNYQSVYEFYDPHTGATIQIATRSTWAIYQYLGAIVQLRRKGFNTILALPGFGDDSDVFTVQENRTIDCFAWAGYSGSIYCVPKDKPNSKMILSLLHELFNLYTKPNNTQQPNTGTVRVTP
jgi:hypothetical protein